MPNNSSQDNEFLKEKLKQRPLNRRRLLRRMAITILMAVLFGTVASVTFLYLQPLISEYLYPEEEAPPEYIVFAEDTIEEEILPADMIMDDRDIQERGQQDIDDEDLDAIIVDDDHIREIASEIAAEVVEKASAGIEEYLSINTELLKVARAARRALVTVTGLTADVSWINLAFESRGQTTGTIVGATSQELMILANISGILTADEMVVTFVNGRQQPAEIRRYDQETGLGILSLRWDALDETTTHAISVIELGSSAAALVTGTPIIAVGRIVGGAESILYGHITSAGQTFYLVDAAYRLLTTDIYGSTAAAGVLINMRGQVVGIIDNSRNTSDAANIISAYGITELKRLIESMCNDIGKPHLGIIGTDVTNEANEFLGVPFGAYITEVRLDTPAMEAGLQSGDVIIKVGEVEVGNFYAFVQILFSYQPGQVIPMTLMRQGADGFVEFEIEVVAGP